MRFNKQKQKIWQLNLLWSSLDFDENENVHPLQGRIHKNIFPMWSHNQVALSVKSYRVHTYVTFLAMTGRKPAWHMESSLCMRSRQWERRCELLDGSYNTEWVLEWVPQIIITSTRIFEFIKASMKPDISIPQTFIWPLCWAKNVGSAPPTLLMIQVKSWHEKMERSVNVTGVMSGVVGLA